MIFKKCSLQESCLTGNRKVKVNDWGEKKEIRMSKKWSQSHSNHVITMLSWVLRWATPKFGGVGVGSYVVLLTDGKKLLFYCQQSGLGRTGPASYNPQLFFVCQVGQREELTWLRLSDFPSDFAGCSSVEDSQREEGAGSGD